MNIVILEYQPRWVDELRVIGSSLREALGAAALRIDHIGSTSVPDLAAKDVIDLQITVQSLEHPGLRPALEGLGLTWRAEIARDHRPPGMTLPNAQLEKRYAQAREPHRVAHVHIRVEGQFNNATRCSAAITYGHTLVRGTHTQRSSVNSRGIFRTTCKRITTSKIQLLICSCRVRRNGRNSWVGNLAHLTLESVRRSSIRPLEIPVSFTAS